MANGSRAVKLRETREKARTASLSCAPADTQSGKREVSAIEAPNEVMLQVACNLPTQPPFGTILPVVHADDVCAFRMETVDPELSPV